MNKIIKKIEPIYNSFYNFFIPSPLKSYNEYNNLNKAKTKASMIFFFITLIFILIYFFSGKSSIKFKVNKIQVLPKYTSFNQFSEFSTFNSSNPMNRF